MSEDVAASKELARRMKKEKETYREMVEAKMTKMKRRKEAGAVRERENPFSFPRQLVLI